MAGLVYSPDQLAAIVPMTLPPGDPAATRVGIMTGGPGTGKTHSSREILTRWCQAWGARAVIALSPTGKASRRLTEVTGHPCHTVHKALVPWERANEAGNPYFGDDDRFGTGIPSPARLRAVLVDEASMLDEETFLRLLRCIPPWVHRILLVGDQDQLPSVGKGCVLRDLIASGKIPAWRLTKIWRQSAHSWITENAARINRGERPVVDDVSEDYFEEHCDSADGVREAIRRLVLQSPSAQVLTPVHRSIIGATALNEMVRETINPAVDGQPSWRAKEGVEFRKGDRVIHRKNNYDMGVMNGEVGLVVAIETARDEDKKDDLCLVVDYDGKRIQYDRKTAGDQLKLAFALTVHSSQGSEYEDVIAVVHSSHAYMVSRQIFYVCLTRARKRAFIVGDDKGIRIAVKRDQRASRRTGLVDRLSDAFTPPEPPAATLARLTSALGVVAAAAERRARRPGGDQ